jgi:hypothetical protein
MNPFANFTQDQLPELAATVLEKVRPAFGFVPNLAGFMANSLASLNG